MTTALLPVQWSYIPHLVPYRLGLALQEALVARRVRARTFLAEQPSPSSSSTKSSWTSLSARHTEAQRISATDTLLLLQHAPVYTEGRRKGAKEAVGDDAEEKRLTKLGAEYVVTQRGGLITFHGPGQLVGYPIWDIAAMQLSTRCYVDRMQNALISHISRSPLSLPNVPPPDDHTGVWIDTSHKIASIGIQVRHRITSHGFALNVEADVLRWFKHIVACGIEGKGMTAVERELELRARGIEKDKEGNVEVEDEQILGRIERENKHTVEDTVPGVVEAFAKTYDRRMIPAPAEELRYEAGSDGRLVRVWVGGEEVRVPS